MFYNTVERVICIFWGICCAVGIAILIFGAKNFYDCVQFKNEAVEVPALISRILQGTGKEDQFRSFVYVSYRFEENVHENVPLNFYWIGMRVGQVIRVYCLPGEPDIRVAKSSLFIFPVFVIIVALIVCGIGGVNCYLLADKLILYEILKTSKAKCIYATVSKIVRLDKCAINSSLIYEVYCTYTDEATKKTYQFKSNEIWCNPSRVYPVGSIAEVRVMKKNYKRYLVNMALLCEKIVNYEEYDDPLLAQT